MTYKFRGTTTLAMELAAEAVTKQHRAPVFVADCGTRAGYKQHVMDGSPKCQPCKDAEAAYRRAYNSGVRVYQPQARRNRAGLTVFDPSACGTYAGYRRHKRHNVDVCASCQRANTDYVAGYRARTGGSVKTATTERRQARHAADTNRREQQRKAA